MLSSARKELTSGIGPERKLLLRVVVRGPHVEQVIVSALRSDIGPLRLQQFEDISPTGF